MQRWWYLDNRTQTDTTEPEIIQKAPAVKQIVPPEKERPWIFRVHVTLPLTAFESIGVTGECEALGNWMPQHSVFLKQEEDGTNIWSSSIQLPIDKEIKYRYFIYSSDSSNSDVHVRRWETHLDTRTVPVYEKTTPTNIDTFGVVNGNEKIDCGWLTTETMFQFKLFNNPFHLKQKLKNRLLYVKLTPVNLRITNEYSTLVSLDDSLSNDTRESPNDQPFYAIAEVVTLKYPHSIMEPQSQFGRAYNPNDFLIFNVTVSEPDNIAYLIDLYTYSSRHEPDEPPNHLGYHYILPNVLRNSAANIEIPITCATKHRPLGMMTIEYLKITPQKKHSLSMERSYTRYWNTKWTGLDVGHRGAGNSFKPTVCTAETIRENTIASLKKAADHGADMVEFDVQLSKDMIPVIYHDYFVYVSLKKKQSLDENDMLKLPMKELTLEQLSNLKVYHAAEGEKRAPKFFDEHLHEHQPFPTLADALELIDPSVGFNVEIKWSMQLKDGSFEMEHNIDHNKYIDCILKVLLEKAGNRRIVFSCFDPDVCTMLRFKQNLYPVMFLTLGVTEKYPQYHDPRCNTIESSVSNAYAMELLGIVAHTEDLLRDSSQINLATDLGLIVFCWGDDNNSQDTIKLLKSYGIHGIIYDKIDILSTKEIKKSIFMVDAKESQKDLLRIQELEYKVKQSATNNEADENQLATSSSGVSGGGGGIGDNNY